MYTDTYTQFEKTGEREMNHLVDLNETATKKEKFYAIASKAELTEWRARARFSREPYHLTDLRKRKEIENGRADGRFGV